jgi:hypothetical protein
MKIVFKMAITAFCAISLFVTAFVSEARAECGYSGVRIQPQSWERQDQFRASFLLVGSQEGTDDRIVGFWKFKFVSEGSTGIPDGTVIDNGFAQWHSDGTEIINSSRPPATGNFCLGVWQKSGPSGYKLNHFGISWDSGNFIGFAQIREEVTLDHKANHYVGTFTIDQYDVSGNLIAHIQGKATGTRITLNTAIGDLL